MRVLAMPLALALTCLLLVGCESTQLRQRGDAAAAGGRSAEAVAQYEAALRARPGLADDPAFMTQLHAQRVSAAFISGQSAAARADWPAAIAAFDRCLQLDPQHPRAPAARADALRRASEESHQQALARADEGQLDAAIAAARKALDYDPGNHRSLAALASVQQASARPSPADAAVARARSLQSERKSADALAVYQTALVQDPDHLAVRIEIFRLNQNLARVRSLADAARNLSQLGDLDAALARLDEALAIAPFDAQALTLLADVKAARQQAVALIDRGEQQAQAGEFDAAMASLRSAQKTFSHHPRLTELLARTAGRAVAAACDQADQFLASGQADNAEAAYRRALTYIDKDRRAREGLARVADLRAGETLGKGLPGSALLWAMDALEWSSTPDRTAEVESLRRRIIEEQTFALAVVAAEASGDAAATAVLLGRSLEKLGTSRPAYLSLADLAAGAQPLYVVSVNVASFTASTDLRSSEERQFDYREVRSIPNPRLNDLHHELRRATDELGQLRRDFHEPCRTCRGAGWVMGEGGQRLACGACDGTGRANRRIKERDVREAEERTERLMAELSRTPPTVLAEFPARWPYTVRMYRRTLTLEGHVRITHMASKAIADSQTFSQKAFAEDPTTLNPNPAIGLAADDLEFPSDETLRAAALQDATGSMVTRIVHGVARARADELLASMDQSAKAGNSAASVESAVAAALVLEPIDADRAAALLRELRRR